MASFTASCLMAAIAIVGLGARGLADDRVATPAPTFRPGDSWVFEDTLEKGAQGFRQQRVDLVVERIDDSTMVVGIRPDGAPVGFEDHVTGLDWSKRELINGEEATTTRPFVFPMTAGDTWSVDYVDPARRGNLISDHVRRHYKVVDWEDVTVPAGTFHALKIEARGVDELTIQVPAAVASGAVGSPGEATTVSHAQRGGRAVVSRVVDEEFYYVPAIRNYAKSVEEQYNTDNVRLSRQTRVLISYKLPV